MDKTESPDISSSLTHDMRRMNAPDGSAWIDGLCGDTMEIYLVINENEITDASFFTDGCYSSRACGFTAVRLARGKTLQDVLRISPADILETYAGKLPQEDVHCAILAVMTLHKALADYLLRLQR